MAYKTTESLTNPAFASPETPWIIEAGSGWALDANGVRNTVPNPAGHVAFHDPSLYQRIADMADPLVAHVKCKIVVVVNSKTANIDIRVYLMEEENLTNHSYEGAEILTIPAILSNWEFIALSQPNPIYLGLAIIPSSSAPKYYDVYVSGLDPIAGDIYKQTGGSGAFVALNQAPRFWAGLAPAPNGDVYAVVGGLFSGQGVYKQTGGTGDFVFVQEILGLNSVAVAPNGDVYVCGHGANKILKQTGGVGPFVALTVENRYWYGLAILPSDSAPNYYNVYVSTNGGVGPGIYKQTGGSGAFVVLQATSPPPAGSTWSFMTAFNGDVYASTKSGSIYKQTGGDGLFVTMGQTVRDWYGIGGAPNGDMYAVAFTSGDIDFDIYKKEADPYTYEAEFTPPNAANWVLALSGANGTVGAVCVIESVSIVQEGDPITVAITSAATDPTATAPIPCTVTFSESVTGFVATDIVVTNGAVSGFAGSGAVYTFNLVPAAGDPIVVKADIAAGVASNAAGIENDAAPQFSRTYYTTGTGLPITMVLDDLTRVVDV